MCLHIKKALLILSMENPPSLKLRTGTVVRSTKIALGIILMGNSSPAQQTIPQKNYYITQFLTVNLLSTGKIFNFLKKPYSEGIVAPEFDVVNTGGNL